MQCIYIGGLRVNLDGVQWGMVQQNGAELFYWPTERCKFVRKGLLHEGGSTTKKRQSEVSSIWHHFGGNYYTKL
jgi:hypothetical protein